MTGSLKKARGKVVGVSEYGEGIIVKIAVRHLFIVERLQLPSCSTIKSLKIPPIRNGNEDSRLNP